MARPAIFTVLVKLLRLDEFHMAHRIRRWTGLSPSISWGMARESHTYRKYFC